MSFGINRNRFGFEADAAFLEFDIHFQIDTIGSRQEYVK